MRILIVHLSDIHIQVAPRPNPVLRRADRIVTAIRTYASSDSWDACLLVVSGDIAFSGRPEEYEVARNLIESIRDGLNGISGLTTLVACVPGNHDHDFRAEGHARTLVIENVSIDAVDESVVSMATATQEHYFVFERKIGSIGSGTALSKISTSTVGPRRETLVINLLNSAWLSKKREQQGSLLFPAGSTENGEHSERSLVVSVLHHPFNWFDPINAKKLALWLENESDIVLTGHEHDVDSTRRDRSHGGSIEYVEGGVLQDTNSSSTSSFNIITVDTDSAEYSVLAFNWTQSDNAYTPTDLTPAMRPFRRNSTRLRKEFSLRDDFDSSLKAIIPLAHFSGADPTLEDLFVYPDLVDHPVFGRGERSQYIRDVISYVRSGRRAILVGASQSGRTSLARKLFFDLRATGLVPVLLSSGGDVRNGSKQFMRELLRKTFSGQYTLSSSETYVQLPAEKKAVIVDDWYNCELDSPSRAAALDSMCSLVDIVVIISDYSDLDDLQNLSGDMGRTYSQFKRARIEPLGSFKRGELIEKWYEFGARRGADTSSIGPQSLKAEKAISAAVNRGRVPSFPPYLLLFLRQLDARAQSSIGTASQGHLYQALITIRLAAVATPRIDLDSMLNYLSVLAYDLHVSRREILPSSDVLGWHYRYCERFEVELDRESLERVLLKAGLLRRDRERGLAFSYRGFRSFFVARYVSERIDEPKTREVLTALCAGMYRDESTSILCSMTLLCRSEVVIDSILTHIRSLMPGISPCDVVRDTKTISSVVSELPALVSLSGGAAENRRKLRQHEDQQSSESDRDDRDYDSTRERDEGFILVVSALRGMEVLGQLLRNLHGSMEAPRKKEIATECVVLGLRLLTVVIDSIVGNREEFARMVIDTVRAHRPDIDQSQLEERAKRAVFQFADLVGVGITRQIADALGFDKITRTMDSVARNLTPLSSARLVHLAVRMEASAVIDVDQIREVERGYREQGAHYARSLLRNVVYQHLFLYEVPMEQRQQLCRLLDISFRSLPSPIDKG